ncbi:hypothetical protein LRY65_04415 [Candidatus Woesebacteria bacterium]|nr:hypothetical protein [Candidatus Woesebacteria bacterium]
MFTENPQSTNLKDRESVNTPRALEVFSQLLLRYNTLSDQQQQVIDGIITQLDFLQRTILGKQSEPEESAEQIEIRSEEKETLSAGIDPDEVYAQMRDFEVIATQEQRRKLSRMFFNLGYWSHIRYGASSSHDIIQDLEEISDDSPEINRQKQLILQYIQDYINAVKNEADLPSIDYEMLENGGVEILHDLSEESREKVMKVLEDINELTAHLFQVDNVNFTVRGNNLIQTPGYMIFRSDHLVPLKVHFQMIMMIKLMLLKEET